MTYLLDADSINYVLKRKGPTAERLRQARTAGADFVMSPFVHFELQRYHRLKGLARVPRLYAEITAEWKRLEFVAADWELAADLWAQRHRAGAPIEDSDLLIAVSALQSGAVLVTNNERHFAGLGLVIENWAS